MASLLHPAVLLSCALLVVPPRLGAQAAVADPDGFRQRVGAFLRANAAVPLPPGDTLLSWHDGHPVLFHTAARDSGEVRAGMLRGDRMVGTAAVQWRAGVPRAFQVRWLTPRATGPDSLTITGTVTVAEGALRVARVGARDTVLALPTIPWAVADYGMEELLLPLFDGPPRATPRAVAVLRPYGLKWDTLTLVTEAPTTSWTVATWTDESHEQWRVAVLGGQHLLWVRRSRYPADEKRPLVGTPLDVEFERLLPELAPATLPKREQP